MSGKKVAVLLSLLCLCLAVSLIACKQKAEQTSGGEPEGDLTQNSQQVQMLEGALKDDPNNASLLVQLGNLYYDMGKTEVDKKGQMAEPGYNWNKAVDYYKRALAINPSDVNVRVDMANLLRFMQKGDEALAEYRQAMNIDPKHPQARINYILALAELKQDYKGAIKEYDALLKVAPEQTANEQLKQDVDGFRQKIKEAGK